VTPALLPCPPRAPDQGQANGLAAAFPARGAVTHAGYFWPVAGDWACRFTVWDLTQAGDLSGFSAALFGDAASGKRRHLATAE
jgi:hypothetical protein